MRGLPLGANRFRKYISEDIQYIGVVAYTLRYCKTISLHKQGQTNILNAIQKDFVSTQGHRCKPTRVEFYIGGVVERR